MTAHVVVLPNDCYVALKDALPAASRFTNVEEWGFNHVWVYDAKGDVLIFTPDPVARLESKKVEGFA